MLGSQNVYLLTYSMLQSPSWEANWFAASQEIPRISRNSKVHYRTHKRPPPVPILGQHNPVHIPTSHLLEIHPNIIHPSTPRSPKWSLSLRFPHQDPIPSPLLPIRATCPAHLIPNMFTSIKYIKSSSCSILTERQTDTTKLTVTFRNSRTRPKINIKFYLQTRR